MEMQQKMLFITAILIIAAIYIAFTNAPPKPFDSSGSQALLKKSAGFGKGLGEYAYSYSDISDGYKTSYTLIKRNESRMITVTTPLSTKKVYLLDNDSIMCISYPGNETCGSINNSEMRNYVDFLESKFFIDSNIDKAEALMDELITKKYLKVESLLANQSVGGFACDRVVYMIDYSNATVDEAAKYGIGSQTPKVYNLTRCIGGEGLAYETTLAYSDQGRTHSKTTFVSAFKIGGSMPAITVPLNLSGRPIEVFRKEREQQVNLAKCHTNMIGEEREGCVADIALKLKRTDLCDLAGSRRDRCLVSIVPLTKDPSICDLISLASYEDDCYIELAGAYKNSTYCAKVQNESKADMCQRVSVPKEQNGSASGNSTMDVNKMINYIEEQWTDNPEKPG